MVGYFRLICISMTLIYSVSLRIARITAIRSLSPLLSMTVSPDKSARISKSRYFENAISNKEGARNKKALLQNRKGSRPLTATERKAKELFTDTRMPEVVRVAYSTRIPLTELSGGQKFRGRIISVTDFGLFVDIGSKKDGLLHIKDVSCDYFVQNLHARFKPGQDIDVWVKFVDGDKWKLGLQLFPFDTRLTEPMQLKSKFSALDSSDANDAYSGDSDLGNSLTRIHLNSLNIADAIKGIVVKVSNFGVYVDVGCEVDAFLPRRKMRIGRKRRSERPWELYPIGSAVSAYVHELDAVKNRLSLTTYSPIDWDAMLYSDRFNDEVENRDSSASIDEDEELGGSTRAANLRALERTLALNIDGDDDDNDDDDDDDDDNDDDDDDNGDENNLNGGASVGEYLFKDPSASGVSRSQILINDFDEIRLSGAEVKSARISSKINDLHKSTDSENEKSIDDLFEDLSAGKSYVSLRDLMKWDYIQDALDNGSLDEDDLDKIFHEANGAKSGKLSDLKFLSFVNILADFLGIDESGDDESLVSKREIIPSETQTETSRIIEADDFVATINSDDGASDEENSAVSMLGLQSQIRLPSSIGKDIKSLYDSKPKSNDVMKYVFDSVSRGKDHITMSDVLAWDFVQAFRQQYFVLDDDLKDLFKLTLKKGKQSLDRDDFPKLIDNLIELETKSKSGNSSNKAVIGNNLKMRSSKKSSVFDDSLEQSSIASVFSDTNDKIDDIVLDDDNEGIRELFDSLCLDEGSKTISLSYALSWEPVREIIDSGALDIKEFQDMFLDASGDLNEGLDIHGFDELLERLSPYFSDEVYDENDGDDAENENFDEEGEESLYLMSDSYDEISGDRDAVLEIVSQKLNGANHAESEKDLNIEDSDEMILVDVFKGLSKGKDRVSLKNILNWDLVLDLLGDSLLTEESLQEKMILCGADSKGVDIEGFDKLVDLLIQLYADRELDISGNKNFQELLSPYSTDESINKRESAVDKTVLGESSEVAPFDFLDDVIEIDVEESFDEVSLGQGFATFRSILDWFVIKEMKNAGVLSNTMVRQILEDVGVVGELDGTEKIDPVTFQAFLDVLYEQFSDDTEKSV